MPKRLLPSAPHLLLTGARRAQRARHPPLARHSRQRSARAYRPRHRCGAARPSNRRLRHSGALRGNARQLQRNQATGMGERPQRLSAHPPHRADKMPSARSIHNNLHLRLRRARLLGPHLQAEAGRPIQAQLASRVRVVQHDHPVQVGRVEALDREDVPPRQRSVRRSAEPAPSRKSPPARSLSRRRSL